MTRCLHCNVNRDAHASPLRQGGVSQVLKNELFNAGILDGLVDLAMDQTTRDRCPVVQGEDEVLQVRHDGAVLLLGPYLLEDFAGFGC